MLKLSNNSNSFPWNRVNYLFNELNTGQQVHAKINESPDDSLLLVFLLFQNEHVVIEELLESLVCEIDTQLLKAVFLNR
jgi:hypothetical protein